MPAQLSIRHLSGSKANRIETFPLDDFSTLTIGRDPDCNIAFDPDRDDAVSRHHALIKIQSGETPRFIIVDQVSSNGTRVNNKPISPEAELRSGDKVELGVGGPTFQFDYQSDPGARMAPTRILNPQTGKETRILTNADIESAAKAVSDDLPKYTVGRETLGRELAKHNRTWTSVLGAALVIVLMGGGWLYWQEKQQVVHIAADSGQTIAGLKATINDSNKVITDLNGKISDLTHAQGLSPRDIAAKYGDATVMVNMSWRLFDKASGKPIYQKVFQTPEGLKVPMYIRLANQKYVRWLTTDDENQSNLAIREAGWGTGFIYDEKGFILTNRHVAEGWTVPLDEYPAGIAVDIADRTKKPWLFKPSEEPSLLGASQQGWIPEKGVLWYADRTLVKPIDGDQHEFEGRNEVLSVQFKGSSSAITAHVIRSSVQADVAQIKIEVEKPLPFVRLAPESVVDSGDPITVLGYPGVDQKTVDVSSTIEAQNVLRHMGRVPDLKVTSGIVTSKYTRARQAEGVTRVSVMGDLYALSASTSSGNSGGPVFNKDGEVIAIFTYGTDRETTTYAVPISYATDLIKAPPQGR